MKNKLLCPLATYRAPTYHAMLIATLMITAGKKLAVADASAPRPSNDAATVPHADNP
jgi:hypothetical protein